MQKLVFLFQFIQNSTNWPLNTDVISLFYTLDVGMKMKYENVLIYNLNKKNPNNFNIEGILGKFL